MEKNDIVCCVIRLASRNYYKTLIYAVQANDSVCFVCSGALTCLLLCRSHKAIRPRRIGQQRTQASGQLALHQLLRNGVEAQPITGVKLVQVEHSRSSYKFTRRRIRLLVRPNNEWLVFCIRCLRWTFYQTSLVKLFMMIYGRCRALDWWQHNNGSFTHYNIPLFSTCLFLVLRYGK